MSNIQLVFAWYNVFIDTLFSFFKQGVPMKKEIDNSVLISDDGTIKSNKKLYTISFVIICHVFTIILIVLGLLAFITGNF